MKKVFLLLVLALVLFGCPWESKTCSDGSFVVGRYECPGGTEYGIEMHSISLENFQTHPEEENGRISADLKLSYTVSDEYTSIWIYPKGYEERREFLSCTKGSCEKTVEWYWLKVSEYFETSNAYKVVYRMCGGKDDPETGDYGVCKDFTLNGYLEASKESVL